MPKGVKIFVFFWWRYKKPNRKSESQKSFLTGRKTLRRKEPFRRGTDYVWPTLSRYFRRNSCLQLPFLMLDFFQALGSLMAWIPACGAAESTHALTLPSEPPPNCPGVGSHEDVYAAEITASANIGQNAFLHFFTVNVSHHIFCILYWFYM